MDLVQGLRLGRRGRGGGEEGDMRGDSAEIIFKSFLQEAVVSSSGICRYVRGSFTWIYEGKGFRPTKKTQKVFYFAQHELYPFPLLIRLRRGTMYAEIKVPPLRTESRVMKGFCF